MGRIITCDRMCGQIGIPYFLAGLIMFIGCYVGCKCPRFLRLKSAHANIYDIGSSGCSIQDVAITSVYNVQVFARAVYRKPIPRSLQSE